MNKVNDALSIKQHYYSTTYADKGYLFLLADISDPEKPVIQDLVLELCRGSKDRAITTLFVTHDIREAVYLGSRIIVLGSTPGRIIADIPLDFPVKKSRSEWFRNEKVQQTIAAIEEAYHKDILEKLGHVVQGGASI